VIKEDLIQRSPIKIFENSIHGGLKCGEIGVIAAPNGIGKTSVLVQIALYKLLQGQKVIHVSFNKHTDHVLAWYEDLFDEFVQKKNLENEVEVKDNIVRNRVLMNFNQEGMTSLQIIVSLRALIVEGGFKADTLVIDGFGFSRASEERLSKLKTFAKEVGLSIWYSCSVNDGMFDDRRIPLILKPFQNIVDVVITLEQKASHIELSVSKDRDFYPPDPLAMKLDPRTLLILEERI
jgi:archaellum biogenesis ATPase FlaH